MISNEYDMTSVLQFRNYIHKYFIVFHENGPIYILK